MSTINYSKWDHIEISDDEDDTHPNIDTPSLFRWRHQARVDREEQQKKEKEDLLKQKQSTQAKLAEMKSKLKESEEKAAAEELSKLKVEVSTLEKQQEEFKKKEEELVKKEKLTPWNVDTICHDGKSKTLINKPKPKPAELSEDEKAEKQTSHQKLYKKEMQKFGMLQKYEDSQEYLKEHLQLVCEETANFLVLWCIDLEIEGKKDLMDHVAHQTIVMQFILELAKQMNIDPRECVGAFFSRIKLAQKIYMDSFTDELEGFKARIRARAKQKIDEAIAEQEAEERQQRLGPGGLDPVEVFESLPEVMKECFESKDIGMLQKVILEMPKEEAEFHMKRCVESGLWVPNAQASENGEGEGQPETGAAGGEGGDAKSAAKDSVKEEEVYDDID